MFFVILDKSLIPVSCVERMILQINVSTDEIQA